MRIYKDDIEKKSKPVCRVCIDTKTVSEPTSVLGPSSLSLCMRASVELAVDESRDGSDIGDSSEL